MLTKFLEQLGGKLAERWAATALTPAFLFWAGGLGAWVWRHEWRSVESWITGLSTAGKVVLVVGGFAGLMVSALAAQKLAARVLRLLEGYWHPSVEWLRQWLVRRQNRKAEKAGRRFQELVRMRDEDGLSFAEENQYLELDRRLRHTPAQAEERMATRLGNILRAAERWPADKYGLDAAVCWPRLWLLLPAEAKKELTEARGGLDAGAVVWLWSVLFLVWTVLAWWAAAAGVVAAVLAHRWMIGAAETYGDLLESAFDVHRTLLYAALRWPLPANAA